MAQALGPMTSFLSDHVTLVEKSSADGANVFIWARECMQTSNKGGTHGEQTKQRPKVLRTSDERCKTSRELSINRSGSLESASPAKPASSYYKSEDSARLEARPVGPISPSGVVFPTLLESPVVAAAESACSETVA